MTAVNLLYNVGSRDESATCTGLAHLFEHLMFGGSVSAKDYDGPLQQAGGENNAFTNSDITNYYITIPAVNIETALWLESDRMRGLRLNKRSLNVQRKVVVEEFKETCLNEPYGDVWHLLSSMAYKTHPYRWPTIGLVPEHVEQVTLPIAQDFYDTYYSPNNCILSISGAIKYDEVLPLVEKWFGNLAPSEIPERQLPTEPPQNEHRRLIHRGNVPIGALYMTFHMAARTDDKFYIADLLSDVLSNGDSSRLYVRLVKEQRVFSTIDAFVGGSFDPGLFVIEGKPAEGHTLADCETAIWKELEILKTALVSEHELQKLKNKVESNLMFSEGGALNKAMNLAFFEAIGQPELINNEVEYYNAITPTLLQDMARSLFRPENCCVLHYEASAATT